MKVVMKNHAITFHYNFITALKFSFFFPFYQETPNILLTRLPRRQKQGNIICADSNAVFENLNNNVDIWVKALICRACFAQHSWLP